MLLLHLHKPTRPGARRTFERACPEHGLALRGLACPAGHGVVPTREEMRRDPAACRSLLWLVVEVVDGHMGRTVAWVRGGRVTWARWFEDEHALIWRRVNGRDGAGLSPHARRYTTGTVRGVEKSLGLSA